MLSIEAFMNFWPSVDDWSPAYPTIVGGTPISDIACAARWSKPWSTSWSKFGSDGGTPIVASPISRPVSSAIRQVSSHGTPSAPIPSWTASIATSCTFSQSSEASFTSFATASTRPVTIEPNVSVNDSNQPSSLQFVHAQNRAPAGTYHLPVPASWASRLDALGAIDRRMPDVLFLDIQMPGLTGLQLARQVQGRCHVVFVTAYESHAVAAFEQGAIDYVLKPCDAARLEVTIRRLKERLDTAPRSLEGLLDELASVLPRRGHLRSINAPDHDTVRLIAVDDVLYFQADHGYTRVVTQDGESLIQRPLKELQAELDPSSFWPIHRSTIVNASAIAGVSRDLGGRVSVRLKSRSERLPVSEAHEHLFRRM